MVCIDGTQIRTVPVVFNTKGRLKTLGSDSETFITSPAYHLPDAYLVEEDSKAKSGNPL